MPITVLVPDEYGIDALSGVDGVRPLLFRPDDPLPAGAEDAEVFIPSVFDVPKMVESACGLPALRLVQLLTAGAEEWIGRLPSGVLLSNGRGAHGGSVAEWIVGALLAIYRDLPGFVVAQHERRWAYHRTDGLQGKRILVVGAGDIGANLRRRLEPFDTTVTMVGSRARDGVRGVAELPALLGEQDAVVLLVPMTAQTEGMVDAAFLAGMADGAVLVNAARGRVVDIAALLAELESGRLRAALDVTDPEPLPPEHPLWSAPGLLLTPHVGGSSRGNVERAYAVAAAEVARYASGQEPNNVVRGAY